MNSLGSTILALNQHRRRLGDLAIAALSMGSVIEPQHLLELEDFGSNPGNLRAWRFVPAKLCAAAPLIVVLHGCGQSAGQFDLGSGWSALADQIGAATLFPEQKPANNRLMCFNWFLPGDRSHGGGEAASIRQMIEAMILSYGLDRKRIFIVGFSAGGAMAEAMLALYPEIFSAGAVIAGAPFGAADNPLEAVAVMAEGAEQSQELTGRARAASAHRGPWPRIAVWHGGGDEVVHPANGDRIVEQWLYVHGLGAKCESSANAAYSRRIWRDRQGRALVEQIVIDDMGHATPAIAAPGGSGSARFILDVGLSSTRAIAQFWGLLPDNPGCARRAAFSTSVQARSFDLGRLSRALRRLLLAARLPCVVARGPRLIS